MNEKLDNLLDEYISIQNEEDNLKVKKENLKKEIISLMGGEDKYSNGKVLAQVSLAENFKYVDEVGIINRLEECGYGAFVVKTVNTKQANKWFKNNPDSYMAKSLLEEGKITKSWSEKLTIKEVN